MENLNKKAIGELTESIILSHLLSKGYSVSIPFGNNQKYDLIIDIEGKLIRAQCKTGAFSNGCITFPVSSRNSITHVRESYKGYVDAIIVYCYYNKGIYYVPIEEVPGDSSMSLRLEPTKNRGNKAYIRWAKDYAM